MGINLLPPEIIEKRQSEKRLALVLLFISIYIILLLFVYLGFQARILQENRRLSELKIMNEELNKKIAEFKVFQERKDAIERRKNIIRQALIDEISWYRILLELSLLMPREMALESLAVDNLKGIDMSGEARDYFTVAKWMVRLKEIPEVSDVWLNSAARKTTGETAGAKSAGSVSFSMTVQLKSGQVE